MLCVVRFTAERTRSRCRYPYFTRTYPSDALAGQLLIQVLESLQGNWSNVAVIHVLDEYANGYVAVMERAASRSQYIRLPLVVSFGYSDTDGLKRAVADLANSPYSVFVAIVFVEHAEVMFREAERLGMRSSETQWIFSDSLT